METRDYPVRTEIPWRQWPVAWSAIWVGALAALAVGLVIGLIGFAVGANEVSRVVTFKKVRMITLAFSIGGAFFAFVVGGWVAARIADIRRSEAAMLHGAIVWLLTVPLLLGLAGIGATANYGGWFVGLGGVPPWAPVVPTTDPSAAEALRNTALAAVGALLLGLVGGVIGGWMASGEPMSLTYYRRREGAERLAARPRTIS
jgi:hypothetical protein